MMRGQSEERKGNVAKKEKSKRRKGVRRAGSKGEMGKKGDERGEKVAKEERKKV